jgi:hypothetical protein
MINIREIDRTFGLWSCLAVTGCASRDAERSRSITSHVMQRCQGADGICVDFNQERIHIHEFSASVENECTFTSTSPIHLHYLLFRIREKINHPLPLLKILEKRELILNVGH